MKAPGTLKQILETAIAGFTWAIFVICVVLCFVIVAGGYGPALPYFGLGHVIEKWKQTWTEDELYTLLLSSGFLGFLAGAIVGSRYPRITHKLAGPAVCVGVPLFFIGCFIYAYSRHIDFPRRIKLADCSKDTTIHLVVPYGHSYRFVITTHEGAANPFFGRVSLSDGNSTITNWSVSFNHLEQSCDLLKPQSNYDLKVVFNESPPPVTSVWLNWLQPYKDRGR